MYNCQTEVNGLPILTGCPADTETFLVMNSSDPMAIGGYAVRLWKDIKACVLKGIGSGMRFVFTQFRIGDPGSPMNDGDVQYVVNVANIITDSAFITLGSGELPREDTSQISYGVLYDPLKITINFDQAVANGQLYILHYAYVL